MKFKNMILPTICGSLLAFSFMSNTFASSSLPGSAEDPVVTKSYVDKLVSDMAATLRTQGSTTTGSSSTGSSKIEISEYQMEFIIDEVTDKVIAEIARTQQTTQQSVAQQQPAAAAQSVYVPVNLLAGQILIGAEGTEIILRSGTAIGYTAVTDGLANVTTGKDIGNNIDIGRNNMLIVPRADGRGVKASTDVWLLVKGAYYITY